MGDEAGNWITFNGEIYNYIELRQEIGEERFTTDSDTGVIRAALLLRIAAVNSTPSTSLGTCSAGFAY